MRMPKMAAAAVALVAATSVALPTATAQAHNRGTLQVCNWVDNLFVDIYADGPSYRDANLLDGECEKWSVRAGYYEVGADLNSRGGFPDSIVRIKRNGRTTFKFITSSGFISFNTNVAKHRKTQVVFNPF